MNQELLKQHIQKYFKDLAEKPETHAKDLQERRERITYYQGWTADRLRTMKEEDLYEYLAKLWAMRLWANKQYVVDKLLSNHGLPEIRNRLAALVWGSDPLERRWDEFRKQIKGLGPAMISEILCHAHPTECILWNRRAYVALNYLGVRSLPRHSYQLTGQKYRELCAVGREIAEAMKAAGVADVDMLTVDYFIWDELQVEENLSQIFKPSVVPRHDVPVEAIDAKTAEFIHDEVKEKIADIGRWLGLQTETEKKVADGAKVDAVWHATIGNMGRVIYVFEVQTKGAIDSLILNLLRSLNNPAVQAAVAVSDAPQIEKIRREAAAVPALKDKLRYWDYREVLDVHDALASVNEAINNLGLVPEGF